MVFTEYRTADLHLAISRSTNLTSDLPLTDSPVLGKVSVETKSEKGRRNSGTDNTCLEFDGGFNGTKTGFLSPTVWEIFVIEIGKFRIHPSRVHRFSRSTGRIKKTNCNKKFLMSSSIGIQKDFFLNQSLAEIWTISWGTHLERFPNHFIRGCRLVYLCLFLPPPV